jgi:hypothetical protein
MTRSIKKIAVSLLAALFMFACSDKYLGDYKYLNSKQEVSATFDEETFVSSELTIDVTS